MNIAIHTVSDLIALHLASLTAGIILSLIYLIGRNTGYIASAFACGRFLKYTDFSAALSKRPQNTAHRCINDIFICICTAIALLSVTFIFNSGNFRFLTIATLGLGFAFGRVIFEKITHVILAVLLYLLRITFDTVLFPILWTARRLWRIFAKLFAKARNAYRVRVIRRHTERCLRQATSFAEYGFTDDYYKEYLK